MDSSGLTAIVHPALPMSGPVARQEITDDTSLGLARGALGRAPALPPFRRFYSGTGGASPLSRLQGSKRSGSRSIPRIMKLGK